MKPYGLTLGEKTVDCLRLCALPHDQRAEVLEKLDEKWGLKAIYTTISNHGGLFDWGTSCRGAWLTEEGNSALADVDSAHEPMRGKYGLQQTIEEFQRAINRLYPLTTVVVTTLFSSGFVCCISCRI